MNGHNEDDTRILQVATAQQVAIVFADICESTRVYESAGDSAAYALNERSLEVMRKATERAGGTVIRTQGDGMLCTFPKAAAAFTAASEMQSAHRGETLRIKIGMHFGPALSGIGGDVYGDAVNLAARICALARAGETLLTEQTATLLPPLYRRCTRLLDTTTLKGKKDPVNIYLMVDEGDSQATMFETVARTQAAPKTVALELRYGSEAVKLDESRPKAVLGREFGCDLVVNGTYASRRHATVEVRRGRYVVTDQSTNGTYVSDGKNSKFLKRESADLGPSGTIGLGAQPENDASGVVQFEQIQSGGAA
jgi:class 3 adenylate cyclase